MCIVFFLDVLSNPPKESCKTSFTKITEMIQSGLLSYFACLINFCFFINSSTLCFCSFRRIFNRISWNFFSFSCYNFCNTFWFFSILFSVCFSISARRRCLEGSFLVGFERTKWRGPGGSPRRMCRETQACPAWVSKLRCALRPAVQTSEQKYQFHSQDLFY